MRRKRCGITSRDVHQVPVRRIPSAQLDVDRIERRLARALQPGSLTKCLGKRSSKATVGKLLHRSHKCWLPPEGRVLVRRGPKLTFVSKTSTETFDTASPIDLAHKRNCFPQNTRGLQNIRTFDRPTQTDQDIECKNALKRLEINCNATGGKTKQSYGMKPVDKWLAETSNWRPESGSGPSYLSMSPTEDKRLCQSQGSVSVIGQQVNRQRRHDNNANAAKSFHFRRGRTTKTVNQNKDVWEVPVKIVVQLKNKKGRAGARKTNRTQSRKTQRQKRCVSKKRSRKRLVTWRKNQRSKSRLSSKYCVTPRTRESSYVSRCSKSRSKHRATRGRRRSCSVSRNTSHNSVVSKQDRNEPIILSAKMARWSRSPSNVRSRSNSKSARHGCLRRREMSTPARGRRHSKQTAASNMPSRCSSVATTRRSVSRKPRRRRSVSKKDSRRHRSESSDRDTSGKDKSHKTVRVRSSSLVQSDDAKDEEGERKRYRKHKTKHRKKKTGRSRSSDRSKSEKEESENTDNKDSSLDCVIM